MDKEVQIESVAELRRLISEKDNAAEVFFGTLYRIPDEETLLITLIKRIDPRLYSDDDTSKTNTYALKHVNGLFLGESFPTTYPVLAHIDYDDERDNLFFDYIINGDVVQDGKPYMENLE